MRSSKILAGVSAGVLLALSGGAQAATTSTTFLVTATVDPNCTATATGPLAFGAFTGAQIDASTVIGVSCTATTGYTIALDVGSGGGSFAARQMSNGTGALLYNLFTDNTYATIWGDGTASTGTVADTGLGMGTPINHTVFGRLFATGNENAETGSFTSQINVTVTYN